MTEADALFPPATLAAWREMVERDLAGAPFDKKLVTRLIDGVALQPLYTRDANGTDGDPAGVPGSAPFTRGTRPAPRATAVASRIAHPDLASARKLMLRELEGGATTLMLPLDLAGSDGQDADDPEAGVGHGGVSIAVAADLHALLDGIDLQQVAVQLRPGAAFLPAAAMLVANCWTGPVAAGSSFGADPIGTLAANQELPGSLDASLAQLADLGAWAALHGHGVTTAMVSAAPWHDAGAHRVQELAFMLSTGVQYLRTLTAAGLDVNAAARQIAFSPVVDAAFFPSLAMLRALRRTWARVLEASGAGDSAAQMQIHAAGSTRMLSAVDPWTNMLRNTLAALAAICGGAESVEIRPHDATINLPEPGHDFPARIARNTAIVLQEESHASRVQDPAGGSWFVEHLSDDLARQAWALFQTIEAEGGIAAALASGTIAAQLVPVRESRERDVATRKTTLIGVNEFAQLVDDNVERDDPDFDTLADAARARVRALRDTPGRDVSALLAACRVDAESPGNATAAAIRAAAGGCTLGEIAAACGMHDGEPAGVADLEPMRLSHVWEQLRDASDEHTEQTGSRPRVWLANLGPLAAHGARTGFARGLFEAAGIECVEPPSVCASATEAAAAFTADAGTPVACICSSDDLYATLAEDTARALQAAGATHLLLAGRPGENEPAWRAAGITSFIFLGCDAATVARDVLSHIANSD